MNAWCRLPSPCLCLFYPKAALSGGKGNFSGAQRGQEKSLLYFFYSRDSRAQVYGMTCGIILGSAKVRSRIGYWNLNCRGSLFFSYNNSLGSYSLSQFWRCFWRMCAGKWGFRRRERSHMVGPFPSTLSKVITWRTLRAKCAITQRNRRSLPPFLP